MWPCLGLVLPGTGDKREVSSTFLAKQGYRRTKPRPGLAIEVGYQPCSGRSCWNLQLQGQDDLHPEQKMKQSYKVRTSSCNLLRFEPCACGFVLSDGASACSDWMSDSPNKYGKAPIPPKVAKLFILVCPASKFKCESLRPSQIRKF